MACCGTTDNQKSELEGLEKESKNLKNHLTGIGRELTTISSHFYITALSGIRLNNTQRTIRTFQLLGLLHL